MGPIAKLTVHLILFALLEFTFCLTMMNNNYIIFLVITEIRKLAIICISSVLPKDHMHGSLKFSEVST